MKDESEPKGMPIYLDAYERGVVDAMDGDEEASEDWFPSNKPAFKLWRCLESMLDLEELIEVASQAKNATKRKRKLKIAVTPLHSFIKNLDDLLNDIQTNPETRGRLSDVDLAQIKTIAEEFSDVLPHDRKSTVSTFRNKLSSHIDKKIHPREAQNLANSLDQHEFGKYLHICLHLTLDLMKLDIYAWSCRSPSEEYVTFMTNEPYIVTIKPQGKYGAELAGLRVSKKSPKTSISDVIGKLVALSQWMFKGDQPRISSLKEDSKENWNTFSPNLGMYKKSF